MSANLRKAGPIKIDSFGSCPTVILLIGPLIEISSLLFSRVCGMLQGLKLKVM